jgi:histidyl-tRNA synthetase
MGDRVKPQLYKGLRDLLPREAGARDWIIQQIKGVYELYGFVPLETPAIERLDVLCGSAGEETEKSIFKVVGPDDEPLGLRYELTVSLARVVAQYGELPRPLRRYQVAQVWRADKPDKGRFREFTQFDIDSVGVPSEAADTEIIAATCDTLDALKIGSYRVRYSSRGLLNTLLTYAGIDSGMATDVFRVLDKLDRLGLDKVRLELTTGYIDESGDPIRGLGVSTRQADKIEEFLSIRGDDRNDVLSSLQRLFSDTDGARDTIGQVGAISRQLDLLGYGSDRVVLDPSIARGLAYYTGPVYEAVLLDAPEFGSVFGGGRYDSLVARFLGQRIPATGGSIGVDRLLAALLHLGRVPAGRGAPEVLVAVMDDSLRDDCLVMTWELRREGIRAEMYLGRPGRLGKQFQYADRLGTPLVVLLGPDEMARGAVSVKDLREGARYATGVADRETWTSERFGQQEVPRADLTSTVRKLLSGGPR